MALRFIYVVVVLFVLTGIYLYFTNIPDMKVHPPEIPGVKPFTEKSRINNIKSLKSFSADIEVLTSYKGKRPIKLTGRIYFSPDKIRIILSSFLSSREVDIGSNGSIIWYYGRRLNPQVNYVSMDKIHLANIKPSFNPLMLKELICGEIKHAEYIHEERDVYYLFSYDLDHNKQKIKKIITCKDDQVIGRYIYNKSNVLIAASEVKEWKQSIPKKVVINFPVEDICIIYSWNKINTNPVFEDDIWQMPDMPKLNLVSD